MGYEKKVAIVLVNGDVEYICETANANAHVQDLFAMGFYRSDVKVKYFPSWEAAENFESRMSGY